MSFFNDYQRSIINKYRAGTPEDPFLLINESKKIIDAKIQMNEIPSDLDKVKIIGMFEVDPDDFETLDTNQYRVDYKEGVIYFHPSIEGQLKTYEYKGRGNHFVSAARVWTKEENGNVLETLETIIEAGKESIEGAKDLSELIERTQQAIVETNAAASTATTKANLANDKASLAQQQADYAKTQGDAAKSVVTQVQTAVDRANEAANYATEISEVIQGMVDDVAENSEYAKTQGDYAKAQGDYAKSKGDQAYDYGTSFVNKGAYNNTTAYKTLNIVTYNNALYQAKTNTQGNLPTNTTYWEKILETTASATWDSIAGKPNVEGHIADKANPHQVSASQVGAYTKVEVDTKLQDITAGKFEVIDSTTSTDTTKPNSADALRRGLEAAKTDATTKANQALADAKTYADGKVPPAASTTVSGTTMLDDTLTSTSKTKAPTADALRRVAETATAAVTKLANNFATPSDSITMYPEGISVFLASSTNGTAWKTAIGGTEDFYLIKTSKISTWGFQEIIELYTGTDANVTTANRMFKRVKRDSNTFWQKADRLIDTDEPWQQSKLTTNDGLSTTITDITANLVTGFYTGSNVTGAPTTDSYVFHVMKNSDSYVVVNAYPLSGTGGMRQRIKLNGTWQTWSDDLFTSVSNGKTSLKTAITGKGGTVGQAGSAPTFAELVTGVGTIPTGTNTSDATITATDVLNGKIGYGPSGKVTGNIPVIQANYYTAAGVTNVPIPRGYHDGTGRVGGNNLTAADVREGTQAGYDYVNGMWIQGKLPVLKVYPGTKVTMLSFSSMNTITSPEGYYFPMGTAIVSGTLTLTFELAISNGSGYIRTGLNQAPYGPQRTATFSRVSYTENITFNMGDTFQLIFYGPSGSSLNLYNIAYTAQNRTGDTFSFFKQGSD